MKIILDPLAIGDWKIFWPGTSTSRKDWATVSILNLGMYLK